MTVTLIDFAMSICGLFIANMLWAACVTGDFERAAERSFFQTLALIALMLLVSGRVFFSGRVQ